MADEDNPFNHVYQEGVEGDERADPFNIGCILPEAEFERDEGDEALEAPQEVFEDPQQEVKKDSHDGDWDTKRVFAYLKAARADYLFKHFQPHAQAEQDLQPHAQAKQDFQPHAQAKQDFQPHAQAKQDFQPQAQAEQDIQKHTQAGQYFQPHAQEEEQEPQPHAQQDFQSHAQVRQNLLNAAAYHMQAAHFYMNAARQYAARFHLHAAPSPVEPVDLPQVNPLPYQRAKRQCGLSDEEKWERKKELNAAAQRRRRQKTRGG